MGNSATESRRPAPGNGRGILPRRPRSRRSSPPARRKPSGPLLLHPVPPTIDKYSLSQGAIVFSGTDFSVSVRPWDYRLVAEEFRSAGEPCPFGDDDASAGRFLFFRLLFENHSARTLVFNPMRASLLREEEAP